MTVARGGIVVAKRLDVESLPLPAVSYELRSEREERTELTLVEQLPATVDPDRVGYHPEYGGDGWTCYDGGELVWRGELDPGESRRIVLAVWLDAPDTALSLLTPPIVESVRTVARDTEPQVLDETLLTSVGHGAGAAAVADHVPDAALRSEDAQVPTLADLPNPGDGLDAPPRAVVDEAADAIVGGGSDDRYDRYYHLRLSVESADRGERGVSVLEDLTNALSVLFADADDRDGGSWRVLDVAIGTNWQAERIVTALADDHRVSGLVVTELTGAVAARAATPDGADPNPEEFAASVFEAASSSDVDGSNMTVDAGAEDTVAGDAMSPETEADDPTPADSGTDGPTPADSTTDDPTPADDGVPVGAGTADDDAFGVPDDFGQVDEFERPDDLADDADGDVAEPVPGFETGIEDTDTKAEPGDGVDTDHGSEGAVEPDDEPATGPDGVAGSTPADEPTDAMETFAELQRETEQADVVELDAELEGVVLSPTGSEEYSIDQLLEDVEDDAESTSV